MNNFITVIKKADYEWSNIVPEITRIIDENLPFFELKKDVNTTSEREVIKRIKDILDTYVAPAIAMDGGAIRYHSFDEYSGTLTVEVLGSCQGCPSLFNTLKVGIQPMVSDLVPQVQSVVQLKK
jgi:Fe-S cluster biogenesis protein NfuA